MYRFDKCFFPKSLKAFFFSPLSRDVGRYLRVLFAPSKVPQLVALFEGYFFLSKNHFIFSNKTATDTLDTLGKAILVFAGVINGQKLCVYLNS